MPVSSAQIKSALLLAGLAGDVEVSLREPHGRSRDHTERLLRAFGYDGRRRMTAGSTSNRPAGSSRSSSRCREIPHRPRFWSASRAGRRRARLRIAGRWASIPTRTGFLQVLARMGAPVGIEDATDQFGEPVADLVVRPASFGERRSQPARFPASSTKSRCSRCSPLGREGHHHLSAGRRAPGQGERPARPHRGEPPSGRRPGRGPGR